MSEATFTFPLFSACTDFRGAHNKRDIDNMLTQIGVDAVDKDRLLSYYPNLLDALNVVYQGAEETVDDYNDWAEEQEDLKSDYRHALAIWEENAMEDPDWDGPETIMLSSGYAELWPDGGVVQNGSVIFNVCA